MRINQCFSNFNLVELKLTNKFILEIVDSKPQTPNLKPETENSRIETKNAKLKTSNCVKLCLHLTLPATY